MKQPFTTNLLLIAVAASLIGMFSRCSSSPSLPVGQDVVIQFDRSLLGAMAPLPISPTIESINGAQIAIRGKLLSVSKEWIELRLTTPQNRGTSIQTYWVPRDKVLLIQTDVYQAQ